MGAHALFAVRQFGRKIDCAETLFQQGAQAVAVDRTEIVGGQALVRVGVELGLGERAGKARLLARAVEAHGQAARAKLPLGAAAETGAVIAAVDAVVIGGLLVDGSIDRHALVPARGRGAQVVGAEAAHFGAGAAAGGVRAPIGALGDDLDDAAGGAVAIQHAAAAADDLDALHRV